MNRQEAIDFIHQTAQHLERLGEHNPAKALEIALETILPTPDPETGLVPCGCGGEPRGQEQDHGYYIECDKCHLTTTKDLYLFGNEYKCQDLESARNDWNRAMGRASE